MIGWIGWIACFVGYYLTGERRIEGFYLGILGSVFLIADAIMFQHWSLLIASIAWMILHLVNIVKWKRNNSTCANVKLSKPGSDPASSSIAPKTEPGLVWPSSSESDKRAGTSGWSSVR